jgi:hypothetical protein
MRNLLRWCSGWSLLLLLAASSCSTAESDAVAAEQQSVTLAADHCEMGSLESVSHCGGVEASCHVCGRVENESAGGQCLQPCVVGGDPCPGAQRCHPMSELVAVGYARIGDCPAGYCR